MKRHRTEVKVIRVPYGLLGRPDTGRIERTIKTWMNKGFRLDKQDTQNARGCLSRGTTLLTFIKE